MCIYLKNTSLYLTDFKISPLCVSLLPEVDHTHMPLPSSNCPTLLYPLPSWLTPLRVGHNKDIQWLVLDLSCQSWLS